MRPAGSHRPSPRTVSAKPMWARHPTVECGRRRFLGPRNGKQCVRVEMATALIREDAPYEA